MRVFRIVLAILLSFTCSTGSGDSEQSNKFAPKSIAELAAEQISVPDCRLDAPCNLCSSSCYSVRSMDRLSKGKVIKGVFDRPYRENRCENGRSEAGKKFFTYIPRGTHQSYKLLVSIHGTYGSPQAYMRGVLNNRCHERWPNVCPKSTSHNEAFFDEHGIVVLAPHFKFYNHDCSQDRFDNFIKNKGHRSDKWLLALIDYLGGRISEGLNKPLNAKKFYLFGQSRGGQFINKFVYAHPERVWRAAAANSGNYFYPYYKSSDFSDLRAKGLTNQKSRIQMQRVLQSVPMAFVNGTLDYRHKLGIVFVCDREVKEVCRFPESFSCMRSSSTTGPEGEIVFYIPGEPLRAKGRECQLEWNWVLNSNHNGEKAWPTAAEFLFRGL